MLLPPLLSVAPLVLDGPLDPSGWSIAGLMALAEAELLLLLVLLLLLLLLLILPKLRTVFRMILPDVISLPKPS